jgi:hypothetical protein
MIFFIVFYLPRRNTVFHRVKHGAINRDTPPMDWGNPVV